MGKRRKLHQRRLIDSYIMSLLVLLMGWGCLGGCPHPSARPSTDRVRSAADAAFEQPGITHSDTGSATASSRVESGAAPPHAPHGVGDRPGWLNGKSAVHDPAAFLLGVGMGPDRQTAQDAARAEIAKIFHSDIQAKTALYQQYFSRSAGSTATVTEKIGIRAVTRVTTRKVLSGVSIAAGYRDRSAPDSPHYALAVLDRRHAAVVLTQKINALDRRITHLLSTAASQADPMARTRTLSRCLTLFIRRQLSDAELRIVRSDGRGMTPPAAIEDIEARLRHVLENDCLIGLAVSGYKSSDIRQALAAALNRKGFAVTVKDHAAAVMVRGVTRFTRIEQTDAEWRFVRWKAVFDLVDKSGTVFGSVVKSGKTGHLTVPEAERRAVRKMNALLASDIADTLADFILDPPTPETGVIDG